MSFDLSSHRAQLVLTALAASAATAGLISAYTQHTRRQKRRELDRDVLNALAQHKDQADSSLPSPSSLDIKLPPEVAGSLGIDYDEELIREQLARNYAFFGEEGMAKIRKGTVVVVGCGGVGSWAAVMLVRSCVLFMFSSRLRRLFPALKRCQEHPTNRL